MVIILNVFVVTDYVCQRLLGQLHIIRHWAEQLSILLLPSMQLTEMASINNRVFRTVGAPLVLPAHHKCVLTPVKGPDFMVTVDHLQLLHKDVKSIEYQVSKEKVRFGRFRPFPFWRRVHDSFIDSDV